MTPRDFRREGALPRFSLDRRITVLVIFLTAIVIGFIAAGQVPLELFPAGYTEPFLGVYVPYPDAPPKEVQEKVTLPLEEELSTIKGVDRLISIANHGSHRTYVTFKLGTDMSVAYREVRDRIERARAEFPDEIDRTYIWKHDSRDIPVYVLGVAVDPTVVDPYNLVTDGIVEPMSRVDGVANIVADGMEEKEILIELDREKTTSAGLNIYELAMELSDDNFTMASGDVYDGNRKLLLRSVAKYETQEELENLLVAPSIRLRDIAEINYEEPDKDYRVRAMSKPALALVAFKEGQANARDVSGRLSQLKERLEKDPRLASVEFLEIFSSGEAIEESLTTLLQSGMIGGTLAAAVMMLFLRRFRMTVILSLSIPVSLLIGLTVMYFMGETLNILTLLGLMMSVGLLVDNSVVVAENIHRLHRAGASKRDACIRGAGEVSLAITMSTLTTVAVFLPVALVEGPARFFLLRMSIPVSVSLVASLLVALLFIPLIVYLTLPERHQERAETRLQRILKRIYEAVFGRLSRAYGRMLSFFLDRRLDLALATVAVFAGSIALVASEQVKFVDSQEEERSGFEIDVSMPPQSTLEEAAAWFLEAEAIVESMKDELDLAGWFLWHDHEDGELQGWFNTPRTNDLTVKEATKLVADKLPEKPGMKLYTGEESEVEEEDATGTWVLTLYGEDVEQLEDVGRRLESVLVQVEGVLGLKRGADPPPNELGIVIDREQAQRYDVNPQVVAGVVGYALRGTPLPKFYRDGREIPVRVRFQEKDRESLAELSNFQVPTETGGMLPVSAVTDTTFLKTRPAILRLNKRSLRRVTLELEEGAEDDASKRLDAVVASLDLPEGITVGENIRRIRLNDDLAGLQFAMILAVVFVFLLMAFLFESFMLPLSILMTIPLSAIGVFWGHFVAGFDIDFLGVVGMVLLVGVVVNNGIVFIDYTNRLRAEGRSRKDALLLAAERRFRPIMMTAITTIGGMVPLAVAGSGSSIGLSYTSFGMTLIGGMATATLLTLLVVPVFYTLFDDARTRLTAVVRGAFPKRMKVAATASPAEPAPDPAG